MELPTKEQVVQTPKNETGKAKITETRVTTWRDHLDGNMEKLEKFDKPDQQIIVISYETETGMNQSDAIPFYPAPTDKSVMGKFLNAYGSFEVGTEFNVYYNEDGYPSMKKLLK